MSSGAVAGAVSEAVYGLLLREPFYGHLCVGLVREVSERSPGIRTIPAHPFLRLQIHPDAWAALGTQPLREGRIKHELLHIALKHPLREASFAQKKVFGLAADLVANQHLASEELSPDMPRLSWFSGLGLQRSLDVQTYYEALLTLLPFRREPDRPCPHPQDLARLNQWIDGPSGPAESHDSWGQFAVASSVERDLIGMNVDALVEATVKRLSTGKTRRWGSVAGELREYLESGQWRSAPTIPWRRVVRLFANSANKTFLKSTVSRPSKRYGTVPGIKVKRRRHLLVALDTSGSVSKEELLQFFVEVHQIRRQGAQITIVECDAAVSRAYAYDGRRPEFVVGRGGTSFDGPVEYANQGRYDALLYFTDGHAEAPRIASRCPLLWVVTATGATDKELAAFPGRKIRMAG